MSALTRTSFGLVLTALLFAVCFTLVGTAEAGKKVLPVVTCDNLTVTAGSTVDLVATITTPEGDPIAGLSVFIRIRGLDKRSISVPVRTDDEGVATYSYKAVGELRPGRLSQTIRYSARVASNREYRMRTGVGSLTILASEDADSEGEEESGDSDE